MTSAIDERDLLDRLTRRYPPRAYRIDRYHKWFPTTGAVMIRELRRLPPPAPPRPGAPTATVVVMPWVRTPVPWYSVMVGLGLARRGRAVTLLWDDTGFPEDDPEGQNAVIAEVLDAAPLPVVRVGDFGPADPRPADDALVDSLARQNLQWALRGAIPGPDDAPLAADIRAALTRSLPRIRSALTAAAPECLVVPGGVRATTGLFLAVADEIGVRAATFDVDRGVAQVCVDGVAAQNADIPRSFASVWGAGAADRRLAVEVGRGEHDRRVAGNDRYGFQVVPSHGPSDPAHDAIAALVLMNVDWDTAALGRHVHFADTADWVTTTVATARAADTGTVVVRQHPSERRAGQRSRLDMGAILRDRFGDDPHVRFVAAEDPTSTYDLIDAARLVLPFSSNVGIEAAALGKPVLVAGASHYSDLGFVWSAATRSEYLDLLRRGLAGELAPLPDQVDRAWAYFGLVAVENRVWTDFTPHPDDFWSWCRRAPDELFADPAVADILEAIDRDVPVSRLRHDRRRAGSTR